MKKAYPIPGLRRSSRLEIETLPERLFRIHVALQICSLVRGYQECLFFVSALQPVFNRDRFLRQAPALFEDKRPSQLTDNNFSDRKSQKVLSPRSKRFLSVLVNSQHFHQLLERFSNTYFFHEVMEAIEGEDDVAGSTGVPTAGEGGSLSKNNLTTSFGSPACEKAVQSLFQSLELIEQRIPTYRVDRPESKQRKSLPSGTQGSTNYWTWEDDDSDDGFEPFVDKLGYFWIEKDKEDTGPPFTHGVLRPIMEDEGKDDPAATSGEAGVHALSLEYLVELEKNPWRYKSILEMPKANDSSDAAGDERSDNDINVNDKQQQEQEKVQPQSKKEQLGNLLHVLPRVKLRDALGEQRFRAWQIANNLRDEDDANATPNLAEQSNDEFDLSSILLNVPELPLDDGNGGESSREKPSSSSDGGLAHSSSNNNETTQSQKENADDRDKVRHCLELAFGGGSPGQGSINFQENGDLITNAELALRNPSAQRYLFSVLNSSVQRLKARSQDGGFDNSSNNRQPQQSVSRLEPSAFECIVRLCCAVLEACTEEQNYESAYRLLTFTGGFCTAVTSANSSSSGGNGTATQPLTPSTLEQKTIFMTERISIHPIFADLRLWERVLLLHQHDQQNNEQRKEEAKDTKDDDEEEKTEEAAEAAASTEENEDITDSDAYNASVTTLYEMVGYNVPAEEVSRFATRISEEKGWFSTEKGQALLVLARRLTAKRDDGGLDTEAGKFAFSSSAPSARDFSSSSVSVHKDSGTVGGGIIAMGGGADAELIPEEIAWSMPSRCLVPYERQAGARAFLGNVLGSAEAAVDSSRVGTDSNTLGIASNQPCKKERILNVNGYTGQVAITAMASFGGSAVVTGGE